MKSNFSKLVSLAKRLHESEQGAEGLEKLMIIGAVVIPLLGTLIYFKNTITTWVSGEITKVEDEGGFDTSGSGLGQ